MSGFAEVSALAAAAFHALLTMALAALPVMAAVLAARWALGWARVPRRLICLLWLAVVFRLVCPAGISAPVGLVHRDAAQNAAAVIEKQYVGPTRSFQNSTAAPDDQALEQEGLVSNERGETAASGFDGRSPAPAAGELLPWIWLAGMAAMALSGAAGFWRLRRRLATAVRGEDGVWEADDLPAPFVLGLVRPRIYLPFRMDAEDRAHVLAHERAHLHRRDPWAKLLGWCLLTVYWWDPAVWVCWTLFCRDMEMACDEAVLQTLGPGGKQAYSRSLVRFASPRRLLPLSGPLAFGESGAGSRVKHILRWRAAAPGVVFLAAAACAAVAVACCTDAYSPVSWVDSQGGWEFTWHLGRDANSAALVEEVYAYGQKVSSSVLVQGPVGWGGLPRRGHYRLYLQPDAADASAFYWRCRHLGRTVRYPSAALLPSTEGFAGFSTRFAEEGQGRTELKTGGEGVVLQVNSMEYGQNRTGTFDVNDAPQLQKALEQMRLAVVVRLVISADRNASFGAEAPADASANALWALRTPHVGDAPADGKLLAALLDGGIFPSCELELFTAAKPYVLQVDFHTRPETPGLTEPTMTRASFALLALIDNLDEVRWSFDGGAAASAVLTAEQADAYLADAGLPGVKACGASEDALGKLLGCLDENGRTWAAALFEGDSALSSVLTAQTPDAGAPYPSKFGMLGQYAYRLSPAVQTCGILVVTYDRGREVDRVWGAKGAPGDGIWSRSGSFWLSWALGQTAAGWNALDWSLFPDKDGTREATFRTAVDQTAFAGPEGLWAGAAGETLSIPDGTAVPLAAVARTDGGAGAALPESVQALADPEALASFTQANDLAAVAYFVTGVGTDGQ